MTLQYTPRHLLALPWLKLLHPRIARLLCTSPTGPGTAPPLQVCSSLLSFAVSADLLMTSVVPRLDPHISLRRPYLQPKPHLHLAPERSLEIEMSGAGL